jgi:purine-cytosine permease-like protein
MDLIGYWLAIYEGISLTEHFVFKRGMTSYRPENYDNAKALPPGIAAITAFCFGVAGMVTGSKFSEHSSVPNRETNLFFHSGSSLVDRSYCQTRRLPRIWWRCRL